MGFETTWERSNETQTPVEYTREDGRINPWCLQAWQIKF